MTAKLPLFAIAVGSAALGLALAACHDQPGSTGPGPAPSENAADATPLASAHDASAPINALPVPTFKVDESVNPAHLPPYKGPTGVVEGTITVSGPAAPVAMGKSFEKCPAAEKTYGHAFREGPPLPDGKRALADAMVVITGYSGYFIPEKKESKRVFINDCSFSSRTIDLTFGQALEVQNKMAPSAGLFGPSFENQPLPALMMATPGGDPVRLYPKLMGRYRLVDRANHDWMDADVYVIGQPLHAVSDLTGHYRIEGVPVGKLKIGVRHPAIDGDVQEDVEVKNGVVTRADLTVPFTKAAAQPRSRGLPPVIP